MHVCVPEQILGWSPSPPPAEFRISCKRYTMHIRKYPHTHCTCNRLWSPYLLHVHVHVHVCVYGKCVWGVGGGEEGEGGVGWQDEIN